MYLPFPPVRATPSHITQPSGSVFPKYGIIDPGGGVDEIKLIEYDIIINLYKIINILIIFNGLNQPYFFIKHPLFRIVRFTNISQTLI